MKENIFIVLLILLSSCSRLTQIEQDIRNTIGKKMEINICDSIRKGDSYISYNDFRKKFKYISIVCLKKGCEPCYPKFITWQEKMDSIGVKNNCTVLFVLQGDENNEFLKEIHRRNKKTNLFYTVNDPKFLYSYLNINIPNWIINKGVLIDGENKIKLIGAPFSDQKMAELYKEICEK